MGRLEVDQREARLQARPQDTIRQEYSQPGRAPLSVHLFPADEFETVLVRPPHVGSGLQRSVLLGDGLFYVSSYLEGGPEETVATGYCDDMAYLGFDLSETSQARTLDRKKWRTRCGDSHIFLLPAPMTLTYSPFCRVRMLHLFLLRRVLAGLAEDLEARLLLHRIGSLTGEGGPPFSHASRMTPEMRGVVERIDDSPFHGSIRKLYLEAKTLELLALRLAQLGENPAPARTALTRRQIERLREARALITARMAAPPSLRELACDVAMSTTLLKRGFRELFGETVFELVRNLRLDRARVLLLDEGASVKEAAWSVGYASLSHFARAFGERFGASPRAWAKARGPHAQD